MYNQEMINLYSKAKEFNLKIPPINLLNINSVLYLLQYYSIFVAEKQQKKS
jgi:hypothetical protein